jgi:hypothetical protein
MGFIQWIESLTGDESQEGFILEVLQGEGSRIGIHLIALPSRECRSIQPADTVAELGYAPFTALSRYTDDI